MAEYLVLMTMHHDELASHTTSSFHKALEVTTSWITIIERDTGDTVRPSSYLAQGDLLHFVTDKRTADRVHLIVRDIA